MAETVLIFEGDHRPAFRGRGRHHPGAQKNIRVLVAPEPQPGGPGFRQISGGLLVQTRDALDTADDPINWTLATGERGSGHPVPI